ncbi:MAG: DNA-binding response regulator [Candidatus Dadabacteria bacterium]|nr:MAG: DNA-binding response regulator [Candidatus Dadabacteria bacterium]
MFNNKLTLTTREREKINLLIVEPDAGTRSSLRTSARNMGIGVITDVPNHVAGIEKLRERPITHVIFDARETNMPPKEFIQKALDFDETLTLIPSSFDPNVDDVFDMLIMGARGYLVKPFTVDTVEEAIVSATKGEPISDAVKQAKDRNEALSAVVMSALDRAASIFRQAQKFETAKRELSKAFMGLKRAVELGHMFAKGGEEGLLETFSRLCIERSRGPASRLGRLRKKLRSGRVQPNGR